MSLRIAPAYVFTVLLGLGFVAAGIYAYGHMGRDLEHAREASGVVVEIHYETGTMQKGRKHPIVRFRTADGTEVTGRTDTHHPTAIGAAVQVVYDRRNPERIEVGTLVQAQRQRVAITAFVIVFGLALGLGTIAHDRGWPARIVNAARAKARRELGP